MIFVRLFFAACIALSLGSVAHADAEPSAASTLLSQGALEEAYFSVEDAIAAGVASASDHVVAGKAALARAKTAPLLRKKRWAKRGRAAYEAALALSPANAEALLGLATLALRAPDGIGGGQAAFDDYAAHLRAVDQNLANILDARIARESGEGDALSFYANAFADGGAAAYLPEYVDLALERGHAQEASKVLTVNSEPCALFWQGRLLSAGEMADDAAALAAFDAFLTSGAQYCARRYVLIDAAVAATELAGRLNHPKQTAYAEQLAMLKALDAADMRPDASDASR